MPCYQKQCTEQQNAIKKGCIYTGEEPDEGGRQGLRVLPLHEGLLLPPPAHLKPAFCGTCTKRRAFEYLNMNIPPCQNKNSVLNKKNKLVSDQDRTN
jgi:hypothetical protein